MVLLAVKENRPIVVTSQTDRRRFTETFVDLVMTAFDELDEFERTLAARA
jgi:hypothetical protein